LSVENSILVSNRNHNLVDDLVKISQADGLSHAYLFFGEAKDEMRKRAVNLALGLEKEGADIPLRESTLIDANIIDASQVSSLGIDVVREIKNFLWQKPIKSKKRTVIILGAEELTREAQNAILKIIEDPPKTALIILVATTPERLLPTITSRLQKVHFTTKPITAISKKLPSNNKANLLAHRFLKANSTLWRTMVKEITDEEKEGSPNLTINFIDELITLLSEKPIENGPFLKELLYRRRMMGDYSLNKRLQLAFLSNLWYNG